jgi:hypothetical protein
MQSTGPERRVSPRFPLILDIKMRELTQLLLSQHQQQRTVLGRLQNLSRGGLCISTEEGLDGAGMIVCEIVVPELPVPIPVITNVRWSEPRVNGAHGQLYGLQFLC